MLDANDSKIIAKLMVNARATWAELGSLLGLSAPAAAERVRKLEERGVIKSYAALVDPDVVGCGLAAFVAVTLERPEHRGPFLAKVAATPEILECHHTAGDEDYLLKIRCAGPRHLERLVSEELKALPGLVRTRTTVVLSTVKETPRLPLGREQAAT